jgi:hypothetical protein
MPIGTDTPTNAPVNVEPNSKEATVLCYLYAYDEYGFRPDDLSRFTTLTSKRATNALTALFEKDIIGKTADGYYHALDDVPVAEYAESLRGEESFSLSLGEEEYPDNINETTMGHPEEDVRL